MLVAFLWLLILPSCTTVELWEGPKFGTKSVLLGETKQVTTGSIAVRGDQIVWRPAEGAARLATPTGPGADAIRMALAHPEYTDVRQVKLELNEVFVDGVLVADTSRLSFHSKPALGETAYVVAKSTLTPAAVAGLSKGLLGDDRVPPACRELVTGLPFLDLGAMIGRPGAYALESQVFLSADGKPAFTSPLQAGEEVPVTSVRQRLKLLSSVSLLLQLEGPEGTLFVRSQPDRVWLRSRLGALGDGEAMLTTPLMFASSAAASDSVIDANQIQAECVRRVGRYRRVTTSRPEFALWAKIVLTPLTLVLDMAAAVGRGMLGIDDDDDDEDEDEGEQFRMARDMEKLQKVMTHAKNRRADAAEKERREREKVRK